MSNDKTTTTVTKIQKQKLFGVIPIWRTDSERTTSVMSESGTTSSISAAPSSQSLPAAQSLVNPSVQSATDFPGTKGDIYTREIIQRIIDEGNFEKYPSSKYGDGVPAHTWNVNHAMTTYDLSKGEFPLITLRPIAVRYAIGELLWIYQDASNNLDLLKEKYGITWWDEWDLGDRTIGSVYGETIRRHNLMHALLDDIKNNPDGRRHIINMWQMSDFEDKHGLKPCAYQTAWNVRHAKDGKDYLDMCLFQRSSDFMAAGCINQVQYTIFLYLVARHCGYIPGRFSWLVQNVHIYDRHMDAARTMLRRKPVACSPTVWLNTDKTDFYDFTIDDIKIKGYPRKKIAEQNPQLRFDLGHENVDTEGFNLDEFLKEG